MNTKNTVKEQTANTELLGGGLSSVIHKWRCGKYSINTLAAPVLLGMMLKLAALPPLQSLAEGPSTVFWVAEQEIKCITPINTQSCTKQLIF
jgi:hypothetical protein